MHHGTSDSRTLQSARPSAPTGQRTRAGKRPGHWYFLGRGRSRRARPRLHLDGQWPAAEARADCTPRLRQWSGRQCAVAVRSPRPPLWHAAAWQPSSHAASALRRRRASRGTLKSRVCCYPGGSRSSASPRPSIGPRCRGCGAGSARRRARAASWRFGTASPLQGPPRCSKARRPSLAQRPGPAPASSRSERSRAAACSSLRECQCSP
mmetsp:Transcript_68196/g.199520  ORF Transcript_68196/g.199520 Transcript_68196/m.199520 type:complete len:208 (-) Transcript_68196:149-772(-)